MTSVTDFGQYTTMRADAIRDEAGSVREVAEQFEALFLQTMLKGMRDASFGDPIFGNSNGDQMYRDLFDQQLATDMAAGPGIGLADMLVRQMGGEPTPPAMRVNAPHQIYNATVAPKKAEQPTWESPQAFVRDVLPHAREAAAALGVSPLGLVAQAALETGWGKHVMESEQGESSFNLFGIKAKSSWQGESTTRATIEFEGGTAQRRNEPFRVYGSLADTFSDYAELIGDNPRYESVRGQEQDVGAFADALQGAGYATDPRYAEKIRNVAGGEVMREALASLKETGLLSLSLNVR